VLPLIVSKTGVILSDTTEHLKRKAPVGSEGNS
jgi:hypothetical protein